MRDWLAVRDAIAVAVGAPRFGAAAGVELAGGVAARGDGAVGDGFGEGAADAGEDEALGGGLLEAAGVVAFPELHPLLGDAVVALEGVDLLEVDGGGVGSVGPDGERAGADGGAVGPAGDELHHVGMERVSRRCRQVVRFASVEILER